MSEIYKLCQGKQEAQLSQRGRATLHDVGTKSLKIIQNHSKLHR